MERSIDDKVVVVTGGAEGLGLEMVKNFIEKGAKVTIIIDVNERYGIDAIRSLSNKYSQGKAAFFRCDITSDLESIYERIIKEYRTVDILVNNAGITNENSIRATFEVNTLALMEWTAKFYDFMRKDKGGSGGTIINVSSTAGFRIMPYFPYYQASKFAVMGFSKSLGHEYNYIKTGVRVLVLCPGLTNTSLAKYSRPRDDESLSDYKEELKQAEIQEVDAIGKGIIEIFELADSGTAWVVEGSRSAEMV